MQEWVTAPKLLNKSFFYVDEEGLCGVENGGVEETETGP